MPLMNGPFAERWRCSPAGLGSVLNWGFQLSLGCDSSFQTVGGLDGQDAFLVER